MLLVLFPFPFAGSVWELCDSACSRTWPPGGQEQDCPGLEGPGALSLPAQVCKVGGMTSHNSNGIHEVCSHETCVSVYLIGVR